MAYMSNYKKEALNNVEFEFQEWIRTYNAI